MNTPANFDHSFEREPQSTHQRQRLLPPYRVVLLNNQECEMMYVVRTIMELTRLCRTEATHKMWQAHQTGKAILLVTHRERAELFVEQFALRGLRVTLEPGVLA